MSEADKKKAAATVEKRASLSKADKAYTDGVIAGMLLMRERTDAATPKKK